MATNRVEGDNSDNRIDATFAADPEGEAIDAGNGPGGTNNDVVDGFGGSDTILSGEGDDSVFAGSGSDSEEREVLAAAKHLTGMEGIDQVEASGTTYIHFMFDQHEVVLSNGAWTESFQPGEQVLDGMGAEQRDEIFDLFPELRQAQGIEAYQAARRSLKKHEARLLVE